MHYSKGVGCLPRILWIAFTYRGKPSNSPCVAICFDKNGKGFVMGFMDSVTMPNYSLKTTIRRSIDKVPEIDVDGPHTKYANDRDWEQFHNPKDLAIALSIESSELLELFLWKNPDEADLKKIKEELADVFAYAFMLSAAYDLDVLKIIDHKIKKNELKYPISKSKGSSKKYTKL